MNDGNSTSQTAPRILVIAPQAPPYGGMGLQATLLTERMQQDGINATLFPTNPPFPTGLRFFAGVPGLRTLFRTILFCRQLSRRLPQVEVVHILACSWVYFF